MGDRVDGAAVPSEWFVCFKRTSRFWWAGGPFGRYKHVSCFGKVAAAGVWVFYDLGVNATRLMVVGDGGADPLIDEAVTDAKVLRFVPPMKIEGMRIKMAFTCASAVAHLIGVDSCALRPDGLLRDLMRQGAEIVIDDELRTEGQAGPATAGAGGRGA